MLIRTKWIPPNNNLELVPRSDLLEKLESSHSGKLTLICAPAGFGKTTLVVDWLTRLDQPYAWLSLDENDNDLALFVDYWVGAIEAIFTEPWQSTMQALLNPDLPELDMLATALLNDIADIEQSFVMVIDDYHLIHNTEIHDLMRILVERLPGNAHLVLISRSDPPLPLPRMTVAGQATNIRVNDLRFSSVEAASFLAIRGHQQADTAIVENLNRRLEGWVAGLRMVTLSLDAVNDKTAYLENLAVEPDSFMAEYLVTEVHDHLPDDVRTFLLQTSVLDRFSIELCDAVIDEAIQGQSALILDYLLRANVFILPLDQRNEWYRYHHLFQEILQQKLSTQVPKHYVEAIYRNAFRWFADKGLSEEALQYALLAGELDAAIELVEAKSHNFLNGLQRRTLERWMEMLPAEIVWQRPRLLVARAWLLYRHWRIQALDNVLAALAKRLEEMNDADLSDEELIEMRFISGQMNALHSATLLHLHFDFRGAIETADRATSDLQPTEGGSLGTAVICRAFAKIGLGEGPIAISELNDSLRDPSPFGPASMQLHLGLWMSHYMMGDLASLGKMLGQVGAFDKTPLTNGAAASWFAGLMTHEQNRLSEAQNYLTRMYNYRHELNYLGGFSSGYSLVRIHQIQKETDAAQALIDSLRSEVLRIRNQEYLRQLDGLQACQWILTGELELAYRWAKNYRDGESPDSLIFVDPPGLIWVRVLLVAGQPADFEMALRYLDTKLLQINGSQYYRRQIQLLAHKAAIHERLGDMATASACIHNALRLGQPGEHIRSIADVGSHLRPILNRLTEDDIATIYKQKIMAAIPERLTAPSITTATLLTSREYEILQKMNFGRTNQEIATELTISIHTVKRHVSNIFDKLIVNNRRQAIYRAIELGILSNGQDGLGT